MNLGKFRWWLAMALVSLLSPAIAVAQSAAAPLDTGSTGWLLTAALLSLLAGLPGLLLHFAGRSPAAQVLNLAGRAVLVTAMASFAWLVVGYSLAYAPGSDWLGGGANLFLANLGFVGEDLVVPEGAFVLTSSTWAILAAILMSVTVADRVRLGWLLPFVGLWTIMVFAPVAHWLSSDGWLSLRGTIDHAGGLSVHLAAGVSALILALLCPHTEVDSSQSTAPFSPLLALAGTGLAWIGLMAMMGGSAILATEDAAMAMLMAHTTCVSALLTWTGLDRLAYGKVGTIGMAKGAIAGLAVAATLAGTVGLFGALLAGMIGAVVCRIAETALPARIRAADPLSIVAIHGMGALAGALLLAPLAATMLGGPGFVEGTGVGAQIIAQLTGVVLVGGWAAITTLILALGVSVLVSMRNDTARTERRSGVTHQDEHG
jgi:ammonium transporter, Amt family